MTSHTPRLLHPSRVPALVCALAGAVVFQFFGNATRGYIDSASLFYWWGFQWTNAGSETEHGWLVLGLSAWLLWRNVRAGDGRIAPAVESVAPAIVALAIALALHVLGFVAQQARISILALLLFIWGVIRLAGGRRYGRAALFPLGFMVFAIPINALDSIGFWLRLGVVNASAAIAHLAGIGVLKSGTQLLAPDGRYNYDVAAACSGVRSLTALAALSLLAGYLNFSSWRRRAAIFLLCFPLVYLGNVARIVAIIFAAQLGGPRWGDLAHNVMGYGVFVIVLGGVLAAVTAAQRWWPEPAAEAKAPESADGADVVPLAGGRTAPWYPCLAVIAIAVGEMVFLHHLSVLPPRGTAGVLLASDGRNPVELPSYLGIEWTGERQQVTAVEREILPADTGFSRKLYFSHRDPTKRVFLSIVLSGRDRTSIHRPELCLVGQGWTIDDSGSHHFVYPGHSEAGFAATLLRVRRESLTPAGKTSIPQLVAYWFVGGDTVAATHGARFVRDAWNRVAHAQADRWAYVLLQTDATDGEAAALARMQAVLDGTLPTFQRPISSR